MVFPAVNGQIRRILFTKLCGAGLVSSPAFNDAAASFLFAAWQIYAVAHGANVIVSGFTVFGLVLGVLQSLSVRPDTQGFVYESI
jgi:hypothetical protein